MSAVKSAVKILFILFAGQIVGAIIGGMISGLGFMTLQTAQSLGPIFSIGGILLVGIAVNRVSN